MTDIVADFPDELAEYKKIHTQLPNEIDFEPGFYCVWNKRYFIHTRATLPLKDIEEGVGFGLWVELNKEDFLRYAKANADDELYKTFKTNGNLANEWPGFQGMLGTPVVVRTVKVNDKVYITEVNLDKPRDILFEAVMNMQKEDIEAKQKLDDLVKRFL
jgi:hypothetical protein